MTKATYKDQVIADSDSTEKVEGNHYFPRDSLKVELKESPTPYTCPWKGKCQYYDVVVNAETIKDGAWAYPHPKEAAKNIKGYVAFDESKGIQVN